MFNVPRFTLYALRSTVAYPCIILMPITEPFDQNCDEYERWFVENRCVYLSELAAVRHFLPVSGKGVEIGAGSGQFALPLEIPIGIDPSEKMLSLAQQKGVVVLKAVAENLPFKDNTFDFALMVTTICFVDDVNTCFKEASRILKPNGKFIVGLVDKNSPLGKIYLTKKQENVFYRWATFYSAEEIISILKQNEFKNIQTIQTVLGNLTEIEAIQSFKNGYGEGGFVVIKA
jgi:ubiquinone/menaquinone biosynthesis C-methylase UbiE